MCPQLRDILDKKEIKIEDFLKDIPINATALKPMLAQANIVSTICPDEKIEMIGLLSNEIDKFDGIISHSYISPGQEVFPDLCKMDLEAVTNLRDRIGNEGEKILGWWHCHGGFPNFASGKDKRYSYEIFNSILNYNLIFSHFSDTDIGKGPYSLRKNGNKCQIISSNIPPRIIEIESEEPINIPEGKIRGILDKQLSGLPFCYEITVNSKNDIPSTYVLYQDPKTKVAVPVESLKLKIVGDHSDVELDYDKLKEEIGNNVRYRNSCLKESPRYKNVNYKKIEDDISCLMDKITPNVSKSNGLDSVCPSLGVFEQYESLVKNGGVSFKGLVKIKNGIKSFYTQYQIDEKVLVRCIKLDEAIYKNMDIIGGWL